MCTQAGRADPGRPRRGAALSGTRWAHADMTSAPLVSLDSPRNRIPRRPSGLQVGMTSASPSRQKWRPLLLGVGLVPAALAVTTSIAQASFPGRNGSLVLTSQAGRGFNDTRLLLMSRGSARLTSLPACSQFATPKCLASGAPAVTPDGRAVSLISLEATSNGARQSDLREFALPAGTLRISPIGSGTTSAAYAGSYDLAWSPSGTQLLAERYRDPATDGSPKDLTLLQRNGAEVRTVVMNASQPDWSTRNQIAFVRGRRILAGPIAGPYRPIAAGGAQAPSWSPGGRWMAFSRGRYLWAVAARGGKARRLATVAAHRPTLGGASPAWSPDGKWLAFYREATQDGDRTRIAYALNWKTRRTSPFTGRKSTSAVGADVSSLAWAGRK